jgi:hypothetical protein
MPRMAWTRTAAIGAATLVIAALGQGASQAMAADANAGAVSPASASGVFVGGSAGDPRASIAGRFNLDQGRFDWLERVDTAPGAADGFSAMVPLNSFVYGIGYSNGNLAVAKMDADTGRLRTACGPNGVRSSSLGPAVLPGRAAAVGSNLVVVGGTLVRPTKGFIAEIDPNDCKVIRSALVGSADPSANVGLTAVDSDANGNPIASGFSGAKPVVFRFDGSLVPGASQTFDSGGTAPAAFSDVRAAGDHGVAVGSDGSRLFAQCFALPALTADTACGTGGLRALSFNGDGTPSGLPALGRLPSGDWMVAGAHNGKAGFAANQVRPALGAFGADFTPDKTVFAPTGAQVFDAFSAQPASFAAVTTAGSRIAGVGNIGQTGAEQAFLFSSALNGTSPAFVPLAGLDTAPAAPVESAGQTAPAGQLPGSTGRHGRRIATVRFAHLSRRPAADGTFGFLTLKCRRACTARGAYTAKLGNRTLRLGGAKAKLSAGSRLRIRLALSSAGLRKLAQAKRLPVTVRFVIRAKGKGGTPQVLRKTLTMQARQRR